MRREPWRNRITRLERPQPPRTALTEEEVRRLCRWLAGATEEPTRRPPDALPF